MLPRQRGNTDNLRNSVRSKGSGRRVDIGSGYSVDPKARLDHHLDRLNTDSTLLSLGLRGADAIAYLSARWAFQMHRRPHSEAT